ncbi:2,3-bisphosphoglycerate-dependent phosphoglycerate mutase [Microbacterium lemovicicum]|uniref:phosphoglycerate mutase (2,3-diphosphoglycerate-dependent) n=1 Tax=Microbacterium lemovicicum TaxID=1072463 RepID=A0A3Q9IYM1_9MICO|nr:histidine phosphatase family protein [Microbacterium lemovicicum]AZS37268.1 2,3-bisphosphoglycerate-dependent phosphoglycerate mutase [Microbacterium lemovicicum]
MTITELWLVRHGESVGNLRASHAEREGLETIDLEDRDADVPLSEVGEEQARALGAWLSEHHPAHVWVSPYVRARQTLQLAADDAGVAVSPRQDERLRDRELGILDLLTRDGVERRHPEEAARRRRQGKFLHRPPGGESWADVALRLRSFVRDALGSAPADVRADADQQPSPGTGTGLIVAHDAVVMLLLYVLLGCTEKELMEYAAAHTVLNASVTTLVRDGDEWMLRSFSDVSHLQREGADVTAHPGSPDVQPA